MQAEYVTAQQFVEEHLEEFGTCLNIGESAELAVAIVLAQNRCDIPEVHQALLAAQQRARKVARLRQKECLYQGDDPQALIAHADANPAPSYQELVAAVKLAAHHLEYCGWGHDDHLQAEFVELLARLEAVK